MFKRLNPNKLNANEIYNRVLSLEAIKLKYVNIFRETKEIIEEYKKNNKSNEN